MGEVEVKERLVRIETQNENVIAMITELKQMYITKAEVIQMVQLINNEINNIKQRLDETENNKRSNASLWASWAAVIVAVFSIVATFVLAK